MSEFSFEPATKDQAKARIALAGPSGSGKALRINQPVLTPNGWVPIGELEIGDPVMGADGLSHTVTGVFPQGVRDLYEVVMSDGTVVIADGDHLWLTETVYARADGAPAKIRTTTHIADTVRLGNGRANHYLPMPQPVEFPAAELPIDPYLLGVLLGDGCLRTGTRKNGVSVSTADAEMVEVLAKLLPEPCTLKYEGGYDYRISTGNIGPGKNPLTKALRSLGLLGSSSHDKHIPSEYLFAAPNQRLAMLQGLLDSDGHTSGHTVEFATASHQLANDVVFLVQSFGGTVTIAERQPSYSYGGAKHTGRPSWRLYVKLPAGIEPFRLERKRIVYIPRTKYQPWRQIVAVRPAGSGLAVCISVDAPDHLFLTAGCVPTHNTWTSLTVAQALGDKVAVIDTERGSASKYASDFKFDRLNMNRYDPRDLAKALAAAAQAGYEVVIVDSLSKFWSGSGGMLEQVDNAAKRGYGGNSFGGWKEARPMESAMVEALLSYPGHVIVTMRTKTAYEIIEDERGRKVPTKLGLKPEQRDGIEYEFDIVGDMDLQNALTVSKSRCRSLSGMVIQRPDATLGEEILAWLSDGKPAMNATDYREAACAPGATTEMLRTLHAEVKAKGLLGAAVVLGDETLTLGALIVRKGQEATQRERSGTAEATPAEPAKPATRKPRAVKDTPALDPEDPWAARVEEIACDADALAIGSEVDSEVSLGNLGDDKAAAIRHAIVARLDALKHEAAA